MGITAFLERDAGKVFIPQARMDAEVGFSVENTLATFGGAPVLLDHLRGGQALLGSVIVVDHDPLVLADRIIADLDARRATLGWQSPASLTLPKPEHHDHEHGLEHHHANHAH